MRAWVKQDKKIIATLGSNIIHLLWQYTSSLYVKHAMYVLQPVCMCPQNIPRGWCMSVTLLKRKTQSGSKSLHLSPILQQNTLLIRADVIMSTYLTSTSGGTSYEATTSLRCQRYARDAKPPENWQKWAPWFHSQPDTISDWQLQPNLEISTAILLAWQDEPSPLSFCTLMQENAGIVRVYFKYICTICIVF